MTIIYTSDSIFNSPAQTLVNPVNCVGVMGKGLALAFKHCFPDIMKKYTYACNDRSLKVGVLLPCRIEGKIILCFPTKHHWRDQSTLSIIQCGLQAFIETYHAIGVTSVSFPKLGCGLGGLDWKQVQPLMEKYLNSLTIPVYIHLA